jgi:hypothetical protein
MRSWRGKVSGRAPNRKHKLALTVLALVEFLPYLEGQLEKQLRDEQDKGCIQEGITTLIPFLSTEDRDRLASNVARAGPPETNGRQLEAASEFGAWSFFSQYP